MKEKTDESYSGHNNHQEQRQRLRHLGFSPVEARNLRMRSQMMTALRKFIRTEELTQAGAAKRLKVTQPRISDLTRGKIARFSLDALVNMLTDAGLEVDFRIKAHPRRVA